MSPFGATSPFWWLVTVVAVVLSFFSGLLTDHLRTRRTDARQWNREVLDIYINARRAVRPFRWGWDESDTFASMSAAIAARKEIWDAHEALSDVDAELSVIQAHPDLRPALQALLKAVEDLHSATWKDWPDPEEPWEWEDATWPVHAAGSYVRPKEKPDPNDPFAAPHVWKPNEVGAAHERFVAALQALDEPVRRALRKPG